ncbi:Kinase A inhibitor [compost metagenome]
MHTGREYLVYMIGFAPGFPYLGGMNELIAAPRKDNPRSKIPAGSVGIAGQQTGIYPIETPGGWQIIGRSPINLFDLNNAVPALLKAGDRVRFSAISETEFKKIRRGRNGN